MKWFLIGSLCLLCSTAPAWGTAADDLYNKGVTNLQAERYDDAAAAFSQLVTGYPTGAHVDDARISGGYAYLRGGKYDEAVAFLQPLATTTMPDKASYQATALYFTALAQFSAGQKESAKDKANGDFHSAVTTLSTLIDICTKTPTNDNKAYLEQAIYYRALAQYLREDYDDAEKDLLQLVQQFPKSLSIPDYYLRLGSVYAVETNQAVADKKSPDDIKAVAQKALDAFDHVSNDPNALVQANEANMSKGEILFVIAQIDSTHEGYARALEAYRKVRRKDDMIPLQQTRIQQLKQQIADMIRATTGTSSMASYSNQASLLIGREESRLDDLKSGMDPIILALIRMAECYSNMKQPDEARTILHRLAKVSLPPEQQQEVDFQTLYSYVLGGQIEQANKALDDYLSKHQGDPQADSISYQIAAKQLEMKEPDLNAALAQVRRSEKDFPKGRFYDDAVGLEANILTRMGRIAEAKKIIDDYLKANPTSLKAIGFILTRAQTEAQTRDNASAIADYKMVRDNTAAKIEIRGAAEAGLIQTLYAMKQFNDVIAEAKTFQTQFAAADPKALPSVLLLSALSLASNHDPGAIPALQDIAKNYPKEDAAPFALFSIITLQQQANNIPGMIQAANDLRTAFPEAYPMLIQAADVVAAVSEKQKKFDDAIALYKPLTQVPKKEIAASAQNKIGDILLDAVGPQNLHYLSLPPAMRPEAEKKLDLAKQAFLDTLTNFPDQSTAVADAIDGLVSVAKQRRSWTLLKDADMEKYLDDATASIATPDIKLRVEMAKAALVFVVKGGASQFPAALDRFKKIVAANPTLVLTRQEGDQLGQLALATGDLDTAQKTYSDMLANAPLNDSTSKGYAYYGLGAVAVIKGDLPTAKDYFMKLKALPGNGLWHPHIVDANLGIALADEKSTKPEDLAEAKQLYAALMQTNPGGVVLQAKAMLGYGRLLEKAGAIDKPAPGTAATEFAIHYYQEPGLIFFQGTPLQSAEGLYDAGQAYEKIGKKADAQKQYDALLKDYSTLAPDWAAKATAAKGKLAGP